VSKIYISSTYEELKEYREAVYDALRKMIHDVIAMEGYVAQDQRPIQKCLKDVASFDIYVGIFARRYGFIPDDEKDNPGRLSITELEYKKAKEKGIFLKILKYIYKVIHSFNFKILLLKIMFTL
jgi:hypothetical protein